MTTTKASINHFASSVNAVRISLGRGLRAVKEGEECPGTSNEAGALHNSLERLMTKHTPGPWKLAENDGAHAYIRAKDEDSPIQTIAKVWLQGPGYSDANARLISAAPDMLEALHIALIQIQADFNTRIQQPAEARANSVIIEVIRDAIKKAEGEGSEV